MVVFYDGVFDKSNKKTEYIGGKCEIVTDCDVIAILDLEHVFLCCFAIYKSDIDFILHIMTQESTEKQINMDNIEQILANVRTLKQHYATNLIPHLHPNDPLLHYIQFENQVEEEQPHEQQAHKGKSKKKKTGDLRKKQKTN